MARLALGLDSGTQGLRGVVIDMDTGETVYERCIHYKDDPRLKKHLRDGRIFLPSDLGLTEQSPNMFMASLDALFEDMKNKVGDKGRVEGLNIEDILVINDSGQQHGQVYLNRIAKQQFAKLHQEDSASSDLDTILADCFAYEGAPIWMTDNTTEETAYLRQAAGGKEEMIKLTGSDSPLRFTAAPMMMIGKHKPETFEQVAKIQLISSFIPALLTGDTEVPWDYGNGAGTSLMNYERKVPSKTMVRAAAKYCGISEAKLREKLPGFTAPTSIVGRVAKYYQKKYGFREDCMVTAGSGDNPQLKVMTEDDLLTLGSSGVYIISSDGKTFDMTGLGNAMYDGLGRPLIFWCRTNCAFGMDKIREKHKLGPNEYGPADKAIAEEPLGKYIFIWHPMSGETLPIAPKLEKPHMEGYDGKEGLGPEYGGVVDSVLGAVYIYSGSEQREAKGKPLILSGGASGSDQIKLRASAIWDGRPVISMGSVGAALGAAVAGADAYLREKAELYDTEDLCAEVLPRSEPVIATAEQIAAYHGGGKFLRRLEASYTQVMKG